MRTLAMISLVLLPGAAVTAQETVPDEARGSRVEVDFAAASRHQMRGELLAVSADSLWLMTGDGITSAMLGDVRRVRIRRHGFGPMKGVQLSAAAGLIQGALLAAACSSVDDNDSGECGLFGVSWFLTWMLIGGGISATLRDANLDFHNPAATSDNLRRFARYPQGIPPSGLPGRAVGLRFAIPFSLPGNP